MESPWIFALSAGLSLSYALGCSSSKPLTSTDTSSAGGTGGSGSEGGGSDAGAGGPQCTAPGYPSNAPPTQIDEVDATLVDPSGKAVPNLLVQVCGLDVCVNGATNVAGKTSVTPGMTLLSPAFKYGDGFDFAKLAAPLGSGEVQDLGQLVALPLPSYAEGAAFPKSGDVSNGDLTLVLAPGGSVTHDILTYSDDSELVFRSVPIPLAASARAVDPSLGFELGYAVAPVSTTFCPPAGLSVKNSLAWAAGSAVEIFVQGLEVDEKWAPYGGWVKVADASVSADASSIDTTSGGIPILSSIALRRSK
jgi:hypothetical protein